MAAYLKALVPSLVLAEGTRDYTFVNAVNNYQLFFVELNNKDTVVENTKLPYVSLGTNAFSFKQQYTPTGHFNRYTCSIAW